MLWKASFVVPLLAAILFLTSGCGGSQKGNTIHGTAEAFKKAEGEKSK